MSTTATKHDLPVTDTDQVFPALTSDLGAYAGRSSSTDVASPVKGALRDVLGWRPRTEDPKAFDDALRAAFRLRTVEGHVVSEHVPRGYAVQADLGAVTGGQASLYRRAQVFRTEMLRILDGLTPLRTDADREDMEAYRALVRNAISAVVDEIGAAGGPRLELIDAHLLALTGPAQRGRVISPDTVGGQLGALRDRFGLIDEFVNTVEEEGVRTSFWTLADMLADLRSAWAEQRGNFGTVAGRGFLGTELIVLSRLMEAAADQVDEFETICDSVLVGLSERRTLVVDHTTGLTLDGLLGWLRGFLTREGRTIAQDTGRDGIVTALAPTAVALVKTFEKCLSRPLETRVPVTGTTTLLQLSGAARLPAGLHTARVRIAVASLDRLLLDLARSAQRIGRWPGVELLDVGIRPVSGGDVDQVEVQIRGFGLRAIHRPVLVLSADAVRNEARLGKLKPRDVLQALPETTTTDGDSITALFDRHAVDGLLMARFGTELGDGVLLAAQEVPVGVCDDRDAFVLVPGAAAWPDHLPAATSVGRDNPNGSAAPAGHVGPEPGPAPADDSPSADVTDVVTRSGLDLEATMRNLAGAVRMLADRVVVLDRRLARADETHPS